MCDANMMEEVSCELFDQETKRGLPQALMQWVDKVLADQKDIKKSQGASWEEMKAYLRDGTILCRLVNTLRKQADMTEVKIELNPDDEEEVYIKNVENALEGASEYGIRKTACFLPGDLVNGTKGTLLDILFFLTALGFAANSQDFPTRYEPPKHSPPPKLEEDEA